LTARRRPGPLASQRKTTAHAAAIESDHIIIGATSKATRAAARSNRCSWQQRTRRE
jgi:hypothetical protein